MVQSDIQILEKLYALFNARDIDGVLAWLHPEVVWANGMEGGYVHGHEGVRSYWKRQWAMIDPHVEPKNFSAEQAGRIEVEVHQTVRDLEGTVLADRTVRHLFQISSGLVMRFDIG
jgi:ketosteroid isomerase-like protein